MSDFQDQVTRLSATFADLSAQKSRVNLVEAANELVAFLQALDITLLKPAIADIKHNISKVEESALDDIGAVSCAGGVPAEGLFWLILGMRYVVRFLSRLAESKDVRSALRGAYDEVLADHHNIMMRGAFLVGFQFAPSYEDMLQKTRLELDDAMEHRIGEICVCVADVWNIVRSV